MRGRYTVCLVAGVAVLGLLVLKPQSEIAAEQTARAKWEYRTEACFDDKKLQTLGNEGWELIAVALAPSKWVIHLSTPQPTYGSDAPQPVLGNARQVVGELLGTVTCTMYFKRQS